MTRKSFIGSTAINNLIVLASGSILTFVFAVISGLFGGIEEWERKKNLSNYHVEEFVILLIVLGIATAIFLFRRYEEMRGKSLEETMSNKDPSLVEPRPALQYEELETLFHRVEAAKKEWQLSLDSMREMVVLSDLDGAIHRCNRAFKDFIGLPYEEILRENIASLLTEFGIDMKGLDLKALNARFHISGKWFGVRSYSYTDFETTIITRVVIIMLEVSARKVTVDKVQFVWGHTGHSRLDDSPANP
jgi:PAS domain-containing protein